MRWEGFKVSHLEATRRLVNMVLIAALFLLNAGLYLDESTHHVVLTLGGALGRKGECAGRYLVY